MPRRRRATKEKAVLSNEAFLFEIGALKPYYSLPVNDRKYRESPFNETLGVEFEAQCMFPETLSNRSATFTIFAERNRFKAAHQQ